MVLYTVHGGGRTIPGGWRAPLIAYPRNATRWVRPPEPAPPHSTGRQDLAQDPIGVTRAVLDFLGLCSELDGGRIQGGNPNQYVFRTDQLCLVILRLIY